MSAEAVEVRKSFFSGAQEPFLGFVAKREVA